MKTYFLAVLFAAILLTGCEKDELAVYANIEGSWELRHQQLGMLPDITYSPGNGNRIVFTKTEYTIYAKGLPVKNGVYRIQGDESAEKETCLDLPDNQFRHRIIYDHNDSAQKVFVQVNKSALEFISGCFAIDGGTRSKYAKE